MTVPASTRDIKASCLVRFSGCTRIGIFRARVLAWRPCGGSFSDMAARLGPRERPTREPRFTLPFRKETSVMAQKIILLVEDNQDDEELALLALRKGNVVNDVVVARDGAEALDYLFGTGQYAGRDVSALPQLVLLD